MNIVRKAISELIPAPYNPRKDIQPGDSEYEKLKRSLEEFGYVEPIIWNAQTGHVVGGHQRLKVLNELGETEIDCVVVDIPEAQEKALNIALNKISNGWDDEKLSALLEDLQNEDIDLTLTGFDLGEIDKLLKDNNEDDGGYFGDERERTYDFYRLYEYDESRTAGYYQFPTLKACHYVPEDLIGFNYVKSWKGSQEGLGVHFYLDDYQFERIWTNPFENIERLRDFSCVLTPGFSIYRDMPMAMKIWNMYRMRLIGQMMQDAGLQVIPTLGWVEKETHKFCFDGIEPGGVYAVGTVGIVEDPIARNLWFSGMDEAIRRLNPECVICYGAKIGYDFGNIPVKKFKPSGRFARET
ncbi:MAG: DUF4417 domain-containing protein [Synergistaceae bacterium]|nr:DUF4417 domain-containing protein [Synergistaceae bacterium]MBQ6113894.1 DUF4417 domain-containing protein [Synergistaceae bacterium]